VRIVVFLRSKSYDFPDLQFIFDPLAFDHAVVQYPVSLKNLIDRTPGYFYCISSNTPVIYRLPISQSKSSGSALFYLKNENNVEFYFFKGCILRPFITVCYFSFYKLPAPAEQ